MTSRLHHSNRREEGGGWVGGAELLCLEMNYLQKCKCMKMVWRRETGGGRRWGERGWVMWKKSGDWGRTEGQSGEEKVAFFFFLLATESRLSQLCSGPLPRVLIFPQFEGRSVADCVTSGRWPPVVSPSAGELTVCDGSLNLCYTPKHYQVNISNELSGKLR